MKITQKQLMEMIRECACEAMKEMDFPPMSPMGDGVKVMHIDALPAQEEIHSSLFPSLDGHHEELDYNDDQGEKGMIVGNLHKMADRAAELAQMAKEVPDNEEWVQEKIAVAASMIDSIYNYMKYSKGE